MEYFDFHGARSMRHEVVHNFFRARRQLDAVIIEQNINYLDSLNVQLDVDVKERIESDLIIDKITSTRLDAMQRSLVRQVHQKGPPTSHEPSLCFMSERQSPHERPNTSRFM